MVTKEEQLIFDSWVSGKTESISDKLLAKIANEKYPVTGDSHKDNKNIFEAEFWFRSVNETHREAFSARQIRRTTIA